MCYSANGINTHHKRVPNLIIFEISRSAQQLKQKKKKGLNSLIFLGFIRGGFSQQEVEQKVLIKSAYQYEDLPVIF